MKWKMTGQITAAAALSALFVLPVQAQQFTTAAEVKPILEATQANWVSVREHQGQDLLYFTHLLAWRCGLEGIHYSVNNAAESLWIGEPCHEGEAQPNAIKDQNLLPFISLPLQSINSVNVRIVYDDGRESSVSFQRAEILAP